MWISLLFLLGTCYYLPGINIKKYNQNQPVALHVNKLDSSVTLLPYEFYYLNFCKPKGNLEQNENIGQVIQGDRLEKSMYKIRMMAQIECLELCTRPNSKGDILNFRWMIDNKYKASWEIDNLPAGIRLSDVTTNDRLVKANFYQDGFPIGFQENREYFLYNHMNIIIKYHRTDSQFLIVGFLVEPLSVDQTRGDLKCQSQEFKQRIIVNNNLEEIDMRTENTTVTFLNTINNIEPYKITRDTTYSYSVFFEQSQVKWASRWDQYLYMATENTHVHWLSIINSFAMVIFLSGMVAHIIRRAVYRDVNQFLQKGELEPETDSGWKQIRGEVFRPPQYASLFCSVIGTGSHLFCILVITLVFACLGFLSPASRGSLITTAIMLYMFLGIVAGYVSTRLFKAFGGVNWGVNSLSTACLFSGICFLVFFFINMFLWAEESSGGIPFGNLVMLLLFWFGISVPLVFVGGAIGFTSSTIEFPCSVNRIPRPMVYTTYTRRIKGICLLAGSLPFGCMFIELSYLMKSIWHTTLFYYLFGFLLLCFIVLIITSALVSILMTYILLCREDYRWWWISFTVSASSGLYFMGYAVVYYFTELNMTRVSSVVMYFGYMMLASLGYSLVTGAIGFIATFVFIKTIYRMIKVD